MPTTAFAIQVVPPATKGFYDAVEVRFENAAAPGAEPNPNPPYLVRDGATPHQGRYMISDVTTFFFVAATAVNVVIWSDGDDTDRRNGVVPAAYATPTVVTALPSSSGSPSSDLSALLLPWRPLTTYQAGTFVSNAGKLYTVNSNFTTGATFSTAGLTEAFAPAQTVRKYPAQDFMPSSSALEGLSYAGVPYWQMEATTAESVGCRVPAQDLVGWSSATVIVRWFTVTTDTGNISLSVRYRALTDGADVGNSYGVSSAGAILSAAPGAVGIEVVQNMGTVPITANLDLALRVWRQAADAGDTLVANMCFSMLELQRAS